MNVANFVMELPKLFTCQAVLVLFFSFGILILSGCTVHSYVFGFFFYFFLIASVPRTHFRDSVLQILQIPLDFQKFVSLWQIMLAHPLSMN